jgi:DNA-binding HxlR family transcriptional regulator
MKRAGGNALALLGSPLNVHILQALEEGPLPPLDLRRRVGFPPESTMRMYVRDLSRMGVIERRGPEGFPPTVEYVLTAAGRALLRVGDALQVWLDAAPEGAIELGSPAAKSAVRALVEGWTTNIVRALVARPYSLTELSSLLVKTSYPSLERRLGAMRLTNQIERCPGTGRGKPYRATDWLRQAVLPLTAATGWERKYAPEVTTRIGRFDVEAAFLMAVPLVALPANATGSCRLAVELQRGASPVMAGVVAAFDQGQLTSCSVRLEGEAAAWATGSAMSWLREMNGGQGTRLELGGDKRLAEQVARSLKITGLPAPRSELEGDVAQ